MGIFRQAVEGIDEAVDLGVCDGNLAVQRGLLVRGLVACPATIINPLSDN